MRLNRREKRENKKLREGKRCFYLFFSHSPLLPFFLSLFLIFASSPHRLIASSVSTDLPAYIFTLEQIRRNLEAGDLEKVKSFLPLPESLKIPDQKSGRLGNSANGADSAKIVKIHNSELNSQLESLGRGGISKGGFETRPYMRNGGQEELKEAIQKIDATKKELDSLSKIEPDQDLKRLQTTLNEILNRDEFKYREPERGFKSWLENLVDRFFKWLSTGETREIPLPDQILRWISLLIIVLVINSIIKRLFYLLKSQLLTSKNKNETAQKTQFELSAQMSVESLLQQARNFSTSGDYKSAIRYLYLSALTYLDKIGLIRYDQAKTDGEYVKEIRKVDSNSQISQTFFAFAKLFQRKWYGKEPCDESDFLTSKEIFYQLSANSYRLSANS